MGKFWGDYRGAVGKSGVLEHKSGNISETRKGRGKWRAYKNSPTLFRVVPSPTPYGHLFSKIRGSQPPPKRQKPETSIASPVISLVLLSQERGKLRNSNLARTFTESIRTKDH